MTDAAPPSLARAPWLTAPAARAVFAALAHGGAQARAVGGSVRNALIGVPVKDVDIATTALPAEVMHLAKAAGLDAHPTGIDHGTVTIVSGHIPYEVTTLRRDIETFGRHAVVTFTSDWTEDARRRDFTLNALYCDADGTVFDPLCGYPDLIARRIRFIGDPHARIREDYLRILRFFRLFAEYGHGAPDAESLAAAIGERQGLARLSGERLAMELMRLLAAPRAVEAVRAMASGHVLEVLSRHPAPGKVERLAAIEHHLGHSPDAVLRLAALLVVTTDDAERVAARLKLSRAQADMLLDTVDAGSDAAFAPNTPERDARAALYKLGVEAWTQRGLLAWAASRTAIDDAGRQDRLLLPQRWPPPQLPFAGRDVLALGVPGGPRVGRILTAFERWWIDSDFPTDTAQLRDSLRHAIADTQ